MSRQSALPSIGDSVYWTKVGHDGREHEESGIVERYDNSGILVSNSYGDGKVKFDRVSYECIKRIIRAPKEETP